jgi:hypothetical protein
MACARKTWSVRPGSWMMSTSRLWMRLSALPVSSTAPFTILSAICAKGDTQEATHTASARARLGSAGRRGHLERKLLVAHAEVGLLQEALQHLRTRGLSRGPTRDMAPRQHAPSAGPSGRAGCPRARRATARCRRSARGCASRQEGGRKCERATIPRAAARSAVARTFRPARAWSAEAPPRTRWRASPPSARTAGEPARCARTRTRAREGGDVGRGVSAEHAEHAPQPAAGRT